MTLEKQRILGNFLDRIDELEQKVRTLEAAALMISELSKYTSQLQINGMRLIWNSGTSITITPGYCYAQNGDRIKIETDITLSGLSLSANTWYHAYAYLSSSNFAAVELSSIAPTPWTKTAYSKTGETSRRYIGSVRTDGAGLIYEFIHYTNGMVFYSGDVNTTISPFRILSAGAATTATAVSFSSVIPITSQIAYMRIASTANQDVYFGTNTSCVNLAINPGSASNVQNIVCYLPTNTNREIYYKLKDMPTGGVYIFAMGYVFSR